MGALHSPASAWSVQSLDALPFAFAKTLYRTAGPDSRSPALILALPRLVVDSPIAANFFRVGLGQYPAAGGRPGSETGA